MVWDWMARAEAARSAYRGLVSTRHRGYEEAAARFNAALAAVLAARFLRRRRRLDGPHMDRVWQFALEPQQGAIRDRARWLLDRLGRRLPPG
jgi:hypothetical protein